MVSDSSDSISESESDHGVNGYKSCLNPHNLMMTSRGMLAVLLMTRIPRGGGSCRSLSTV